LSGWELAGRRHLKPGGSGPGERCAVGRFHRRSVVGWEGGLMKDFVLKTLLYPFLAILFCLAFGVPFTAAGFQVVQVVGERQADHSITMELSRRHYWGLLTVEEQIEDVRFVTRDSSLIRRIGPRHALVSGIYLVSETQAVPLFFGASNVDDRVKQTALESISAYIADDAQQTYSETFSIANLFGWFGLPFLVLGVWGLLGWPFAIVRSLRDQD